MSGLYHRKLGRPTAHRLAMLRNQVTALIKHERITTTFSRAKETQRMAEKMVTLAKKGHDSAYRQALGFVYEKPMVDKLFYFIAPRYADREGGYTRVLRRGFRDKDNATMAWLEFVDRPGELRAAVPPRKKEDVPKTSVDSAEDNQTA